MRLPARSPPTSTPPPALRQGFGCQLLAHDVCENPEVVALGARYVTLEELMAQVSRGAGACAAAASCRFCLLLLWLLAVAGVAVQ